MKDNIKEAIDILEYYAKTCGKRGGWFDNQDFQDVLALLRQDEDKEVVLQGSNRTLDEVLA